MMPMTLEQAKALADRIVGYSQKSETEQACVLLRIELAKYERDEQSATEGSGEGVR